MGTNTLPKLGAEFKKHSKEAFEAMILKKIFSDNSPRQVLLKRRDDWIKDLNFNLIKGKVVKASHYFDDELNNEQKVKLVKCLASEPGKRDLETVRTIEKYVRSMSLFKPYAHFESDDFASLIQEIKLHKVKKNTRLCTFGDMADRVYVIVNGRLAINYPTASYFKILEQGGTKLLKERTMLMSDKELNRYERRQTELMAKMKKLTMGGTGC